MVGDSLNNPPRNKTAMHTKLKESDSEAEYGSTSSHNYKAPSNNMEQSKCSRFLQLLKSLRIEPVMFLFMFSFILNTTCLTNMMMDKGCLNYYNYSKEMCENISEYKDERDNVEILANNYNLYLNLLAPISAFVVIFLAPWSDKYGRKPLLVLALFGFFLNDIGIILCTVYFNSPLYFILISNIPTQLSGGFISVMTIIYSHISDVTTEENRSLKYTFLQIAFGVAVTLGALAGGQIYHYFGYLAVYGTMTIGHFLAILWVLLLVPETRGLAPGVPFSKKLKDLLDSQNFTDGLKTCWKRRENNGRMRLCLLLLSSCTVALTYEVYTDIAYVYAHHMYKWNPTTYSEMWTIFSFSEMVVVFTVTPVLIKWLKVGDPVIGIIGSLSIICKNVFLAFAYTLWMYVLSNATGFFNGLVNLAVRSLISKLVAEDELGRVFSFLATCEAIVPMLGSAIITKIFNATLKVFPGACYLADTIFLMLPLGTFIWHLKLSGSHVEDYERNASPESQSSNTKRGHQ